MQQDIYHILSTQYPSTVHDAVRYGYLYRKESEVCDSSLHFSLPDASAIMLWIASAVASGVVYDVIKDGVRSLRASLRENNHKLDKDAEKVLSDDEVLKEFTTYIEEYYAHDMRISIEQEEYIKEEVIADAIAAESCKIREKSGRLILTKEESISVTKIAYRRAEELIHRHD